MTYYKIMIDNEVVGAGTSRDMVRFQKKHRILLGCDESKAQYIMFQEKLYHDYWMSPIESTLSHNDANVQEVSKEIYDSILSAIEKNEEIILPEETVTMPYPPEIPEDEVATLEFIKESKLAELSSFCNKTITKGFDATLSDGCSYHFSLSTQDQLNLLTLSTMVVSGETSIPYHADGELCKFYTKEDIQTILSEATKYKTYHISYFNSLKNWILSIEDIADISKISYGDTVPDEFCSTVLSYLT